MRKSIHSQQYAMFLKALRDARKRAGLTQNDMAARIGETQTFVSKVERGERRVDVVELRAFCEAFDLRLRDFVVSFESALQRGRQEHPPKAGPERRR